MKQTIFLPFLSLQSVWAILLQYPNVFFPMTHSPSIIKAFTDENFPSLLSVYSHVYVCSISTFIWKLILSDLSKAIITVLFKILVFTEQICLWTNNNYVFFRLDVEEEMEETIWHFKNFWMTHFFSFHDLRLHLATFGAAECYWQKSPHCNDHCSNYFSFI